MENSMVKRKLVILDCTGLLCSSRKETEARLPGRPSSQDGIHHINIGNVNLIFFERLRLHQFLAKCFDIFDVAIWTSVGKRMTQTIVQTIFTQNELSKFKFIWDRSHCTDSFVPRDDVDSNIFLKDLRLLWVHQCPGVYDDSNTVLIEVCPMKTFQNPEFTSLYPTPFKFGDCKDTFLTDILWPVLNKLSLAVDVRRFLWINMPKWSLKNIQLDRKRNSDVYAALKKRIVVTMPTVPKYTLLDVSDHEVTWKEKYLISKLPTRSHSNCAEDKVRPLVLDLLGRLYEGPYVKDPLRFVYEIQNVLYMGKKFLLKEATPTLKQQTRSPIIKKFGSISNVIFNVVGKDDEVVIKVGDVHLERRALMCLKPGEWLNCEVMDAYMELLQIRNTKNGGKVMFFPTHFYELIAKSKGYDFRSGLAYVRGKEVFEMDLLVIPMNQGKVHWVMVVVNIKEKRIEFYDPLQHKSKKEMSIMQKWFAELATLRSLHTLKIQCWGTQMMTNFPKQKDSYNCGVFVLHLAEFLGRGVPLVIDVKNLVYLRNQILEDLYAGIINRE